MFCHHCSLLCDAIDSKTEFQIGVCPKRLESRKELESLRSNGDPIASLDLRSSALLNSASAGMREILEKAKNVHITGSVISVESAKQALKLAAKWSASIDLDPDGRSQMICRSIAQNGIYSASIAEVREMADLILIVGEEMLRASPRLVEQLRHPSKVAEICILSDSPKKENSKADSANDLGASEFLRNGCTRLSCNLVDLPRWLLCESPVKNGSDNLDERQLSKKILEAKYIAIVLSPSGIDSIEPVRGNGDLWLSELTQWMAKWNKKSRAMVLNIGSLDAIFAHVCTWTTGYPGQVRFQAGNPSPQYDPILYSSQKWLELYGNDTDSLVIDVCDYLQNGPSMVDKHEAHRELKCHRINLTPRTAFPLRGRKDSRMTVPVSVAGDEYAVQVLRGDGVLVARTSDDLRPANNQLMENEKDGSKTERILSSGIPSLEYWIKELTR